MARLLKERARRALVERGAAVGSQTHQNGEPHYVLEIYQPMPGATYRIILTREEMLKATASWIGGEARLAAAPSANQGRR